MCTLMPYIGQMKQKTMSVHVAEDGGCWMAYV